MVMSGQSVEVWQDMSTAPKDGEHCILAITTGAFVYVMQDAFVRGKWMNAADIDGEPLCWMPNSGQHTSGIFTPDEFKARSALATPTPKEESK